MFCRKCGKEINNTSRFCPFCGTPVVMLADPAPVANPEPAAPIPAEAAPEAPVQPAPEQPAPEQPASVPPAYSPIPADKPEKKKKGKAGVIIAIILIVLLLAGCAAAAYFFVFASPAKKISKAIEAGNMETVTELYEKVNSEKDKDQIKSDLLTYVQTLEDNYLAEETTYEDAIRIMEDLRDVVFTDGEIEDIMHTVSKIHDSRENYIKAEELAAAGTWKTYYDAILYYEEVVSEDTLYYDKAQDAIANCKTECISAAEAEADGYIADGDFDAAVDLLQDAYYSTGYDELYDKMNQVKADMKDALLEKAIENARAEVAAGNYTEARNIINNAKEDYGYDSRFDDILASIPVDTSLVGKWKLEYDMNDIIASTVGEDMDNFDSEFYVTFVFEFTEDGICRLSLDEDSFVKSFDSWKDDLLDYLIDMALEEYISDGSMTKKEFEKAFKSTYGMTLKEYFSAMLDEELDVSELLDETETEMKYYVEGDKLYLVDDTDTEDYYENFYIEGGTLVLGGDGSLSEAEILPGLSYPLQLTKVVD